MTLLTVVYIVVSLLTMLGLLGSHGISPLAWGVITATWVAMTSLYALGLI